MPEAVDPAPVPTAPEQGFFSSARSLDGLKPGEMLYPPSRVINFTSNFAIETVITHLRNAWNIQPHQVAPESTRERVADALGKWHRLRYLHFTSIPYTKLTELVPRRKQPCPDTQTRMRLTRRGVWISTNFTLMSSLTSNAP